MAKRRKKKRKTNYRNGCIAWLVLIGIFVVLIIANGGELTTPEQRGESREPVVRLQPTVADSATRHLAYVALAQVPGVEEVITVSQTGAMFYSEINMETGTNTLDTASRMRLIVDSPSLEEYTFILDDGATAIDFFYTNGEWRDPTVLTITMDPQQFAVTATALVGGFETWYTTGRANARSCSALTCDVVTVLDNGQAVQVGTWEQGASVNGNDIWREVQYGGGIVWVHSSLLAVDAPAGQQPASQSSGSQFSCAGDQYNCGDFDSCSAVMSYFNACPGDPSRLDPDGNGVPCGSLCEQSPAQQDSAQQAPVQQPPVNPQYSCSGDLYNCSDFNSCSAVMSYFNACPGDPSDLDGNEDGVPCETLCR